MKRLCLYILLLVSACARGQITLSEVNYPTAVIICRDSIMLTSTGSSFPPLAPVSGGVWDFTTLSDSPTIVFDYRVPGTSYEFADSNQYSFLGASYRGTVQSYLLTTGILQYQVNVDSANCNIGGLTISAFDSLFIPNQSVSYSSPHISVGLPATIGSSWVSQYSYDFRFKLSTSVFSYNHAPGVVRSYIKERSDVVGWGQARINNAAGVPSVYFDVLQIQTTTIKQDSFFLNAAPLSGTLLTLFGLYQGHIDTTYVQSYLRQGEITPLISIEASDSAYAHPIRARKHVGRLYPFVDGIENVTGTTSFVFPNPVTNKELTITTPDGDYNYTLSDVVGRVQASGVVTVKNKTGKIVLPGNIINGCYYLSVAGGAGCKTIPVQISR